MSILSHENPFAERIFFSHIVGEDAKGVFRSKNFWQKIPVALFVVIW
jgi:hypothetical protein